MNSQNLDQVVVSKLKIKTPLVIFLTILAVRRMVVLISPVYISAQRSSLVSRLARTQRDVELIKLHLYVRHQAMTPNTPHIIQPIEYCKIYTYNFHPEAFFTRQFVPLPEMGIWEKVLCCLLLPALACSCLLMSPV